MMDKLKRYLFLPILSVSVTIFIWQLYLLSIASAVSEEIPHPLPEIKQASKLPDMGAVAVTHTTDVSAARELSGKQLEYLQLVNELRITQVKKLIAQDNEAIALSQQRALQARNQIVKSDAAKDSKTVAEQSDLVVPVKGNDAELKLVYTGEQGGQWSATVNYQGHLYDVVKGTKLPNGDAVVNIDQDVVILNQGNWKKVLGFYDTTRYYQAPAVAKAVDPAPVVAKAAAPAAVTEVLPRIAAKAIAKLPALKPIVAEPTSVAVKAEPAKAKIAVERKVKPASAQNKIVKQAHLPVAKVDVALHKTPVKVAMSEPSKKVEPAKVAASEPSKKAEIAKVAVSEPSKKVEPAKVAVSEPSKKAEIAKVAVSEPSKKVEPAKVAVSEPSKRVEPAKIAVSEPSKKADPVKVAVAPESVKLPVVAKALTVAKAQNVKAKVTEPLKVVMIKQKVAPAKAKRNYTEIERQLLTQDPQQYTLQIFETAELNRAKQFISEHRLTQAKVYTRFDETKQAHYVVVMDHYRTSEQALMALANLPIELHQFGPEVKSMANVQYELQTDGDDGQKVG